MNNNNNINAALRPDGSDIPCDSSASISGIKLSNLKVGDNGGGRISVVIKYR
ncbi:MAG: hypothetical protein KAI55_04735 [Candidatus Aenigmarchaeota archaeon]|nr:hypothetical protein [Candidatus Aenigmarchaeota archaeon]